MQSAAAKPMPYQTDHSDYRDILGSMFGLISPEAGQVEWILDRIEGQGASQSRGRTWA